MQIVMAPAGSLARRPTDRQTDRGGGGEMPSDGGASWRAGEERREGAEGRRKEGRAVMRSD